MEVEGQADRHKVKTSLVCPSRVSLTTLQPARWCTGNQLMGWWRQRSDGEAGRKRKKRKDRTNDWEWKIFSVNQIKQVQCGCSVAFSYTQCRTTEEDILREKRKKTVRLPWEKSHM